MRGRLAKILLQNYTNTRLQIHICQLQYTLLGNVFNESDIPPNYVYIFHSPCHRKRVKRSSTSSYYTSFATI